MASATINRVACAIRLVTGQSSSGANKVKSVSLGNLSTAAATGKDNELFAIATALSPCYSEPLNDVRKTVTSTLEA